MFRNNRFSSDVVAEVGEQTQASWKPNLRRIQKGLFSKDGSLSSNDYASTAAASNGPPNTTLQDKDAYLTRKTSLVSSGYAPRRAATVSKPRTSDSRDPKAFTFLKSSASASKSRTRQHRPTESQGGLLVESRISNQQGNKPYVPKHAASGFSRSTQRQKGPQGLPSSPSTPAVLPYIPTHAASDFSKIKLPTKMTEADPKPIVASPTTIEDASNDYQLFLAAARAAAARNYNTTGVISPNKPKPCPQVSEKMKEIVSKHQETVRQRAISISQQSAMSSKPASILDKVGEYIKPSRTPSIYSQRTRQTDDKGSVKGSVKGSMGTDRAGKWSRTTSIRRSLSCERDCLDERQNALRAPGRKKALRLLGLEEDQDLKGRPSMSSPRSSVAPVIPSPFRR